MGCCQLVACVGRGDLLFLKLASEIDVCDLDPLKVLLHDVVLSIDVISVVEEKLDALGVAVDHALLSSDLFVLSHDPLKLGTHLVESALQTLVVKCHRCDPFSVELVTSIGRHRRGYTRVEANV